AARVGRRCAVCGSRRGPARPRLTARGPRRTARRPRPSARPASFAVLSVERTPLRAAEPFTLTMAIELAEPTSHADRLAYSAVVVAMPLTGGQKRTVAKSDGGLAATSSTISLAAAGLSPRAYRLHGPARPLPPPPPPPPTP